MKKTMLLAATAAVILSSCSKNEEIDKASQLSDNLDAIGINIATGITKADVTTGTLQTSAENTAGAVYLEYYNTKSSEDLEIAYTYASGVWTPSTTVMWSTVEYPTTFFSMHNGTARVPLTTSVDAGDKTLASATTDAISVNTTIANQIDHIFFAGKIGGQPQNGKVPATFQHALSKVNVIASAGTNSAYISTIDVENFSDSSTPTLSQPTSIAWSTDATKTLDLPYRTKPAVVETAITGKSTALGAAPMYLLPEELVSPTVVDNNIADFTTGQYLEVIYRLDAADGTPLVGYSSVAEYIEINGLPEGTTVDRDLTGDGTFEDENYTGPMYVRVGFPVTHTNVFDKHYNYVLNFDGGNGGHLKDDTEEGGGTEGDNYVDEDGNPLDVEFPDKEPGDPVISDMPIGLNVIAVDIWEAANDTTIE